MKENIKGKVKKGSRKDNWKRKDKKRVDKDSERDTKKKEFQAFLPETLLKF